MAEVDLVAGALVMPELANALHVVRDTAEKYRDVLSAFFANGHLATPLATCVNR